MTDHPPYPFPKYPYECKHPLTRREVKTNNRGETVLVTCLDCGAILYMDVSNDPTAVAKPQAIK